MATCTYGVSNSKTGNPYDNFIDNFNADEHPNFLHYTLHIMEKHAYADQARVLKTVRERLETKYELDTKDPWEKMK